MYRKFGKRLFDLLLVVPMLILLSPLLVLVALTVRVFMGTPVLFRHERPGLQGRTFTVLKYRTMSEAVDEKGNLLPDRDRLTPIGKLIRKLSLDELPQLWNVVRGDMSLVGPRPLFTAYLPYYSQREQKRHLVRPGITGLAQVSGRNKVDWDSRLELDVQYIENLSFKLDMSTLFKTFFQLIRSKDVLVTPGTAVEPLNVVRERQGWSAMGLQDEECKQS
jgi:lipopolysaccharide/colanic/teichoic acid biosynthesis glycosyltransferase